MSSSITPLRAPLGANEAVELLREIRDLLRRLVADQRRREAAPALVEALREHFGPSRFTVRSVLDIVAEDPHGTLAAAVGAVIDLNASPHSRATSLGALFSKLAEVEIVAAQRPAIYRLRT